METYFIKLFEFQEPKEGAPPAAMLFGGAGVEYMEKYGTKPETFGKISVKARKHAEHNERAVFRNLLTVEEVMELTGLGDSAARPRTPRCPRPASPSTAEAVRLVAGVL